MSTEKKEIKSGTKTAKKETKRYSAKKLPGLFKKTYTDKKFKKRILNKLYIPEDKKEVEALFKKNANPQKPGMYAIPMTGTYTKKEICHYKDLVKQIQGQKGRVKFLPLIAVVSAIAALVIVIGIFKNPLVKKGMKAGCEAAFGAKTEIGSVDLRLMSASLTVNNLTVGNKNSVMKNLFQVEKIKVDFNLVQALRGKFDAQNLEVTGVALNTDRTTSGELPKKQQKAQKKSEGDSKFVVDLKAKSGKTLDDLKTQAGDMLGGTDVDTIVANIQSQLKSKTAADDAKKTIDELTAKWKDKPAEMKTQVNEFSESVSQLQKLEVNKIKDAASLKAALDQVNEALTKGDALKKTTETTTNELKADAETVKKVGGTVTAAVSSDMELAKSKLASAVDAVKNAKVLLNKALDTVGYDMLGKYYPYVKKLVAYAEKMKNTSSGNKDKTAKKSKKKTGSNRLEGTTFWYAKENPSFLIEHALASGTGFTAEATEISSDQDVRGKPMTVKGTYTAGTVSHAAYFILDARSESTALLITLDYSGKGFAASVDGTSIASKSGVPSVNGTAALSMKMTAGSDGFTASGGIQLNPLSLTSDGFENDLVTKYYNQALASVKKMDVSYKAAFTESNGVSFGLDGNYADAFADALKNVVASMGDDAKNAALKKIQDEVNSSSSGILAEIKSFAGIKGDIDLQNAKLSAIQKTLDDKKVELENKIKTQASDAVKSKVDNATGGAASKLKGALGL